jgi:tetratricopeptide (TPR) repeat protein
MAERPESPDFASWLGWKLATCPAVQFRDPARAVALAKQALRHQPQSGENWKLLGIAQYRAGDLRAAVEALDRAIGLVDGGDALHWTFLAMAHRRLSHEAEARRWNDKAARWVEKSEPIGMELRRYRAEADKLFGVEGRARSEAK